MYVKHGADTTDIRGSEAKYRQVNRQYLRDVSFFLMDALRVSIAETLSTVHQSQSRRRRLGTVERVEHICFLRLSRWYLLFIYRDAIFHFIYKPAYTKGTFFASLEISLCATGIRGFTPDTPENRPKRKIIDFFFVRL